MCGVMELAKSFANQKVKFEMDATTAHLAGNKSAVSTIAIKSIKGEGCMQIKDMLTNPNSVHYDLWCAGLSIANMCVDGDTAIHTKSSKGHDGYTFEATEDKALEFYNLLVPVHGFKIIFHVVAKV
jgi:hypothetical protein